MIFEIVVNFFLYVEHINLEFEVKKKKKKKKKKDKPGEKKTKTKYNNNNHFLIISYYFFQMLYESFNIIWRFKDTK